MLTFFTTAKPFRGHNGIIQRNALKSWTLLRPDIEIILFGNEEGASSAAEELRIRHEPRVLCNEFGTNRLDFMFSRAQEMARHELLCYINCDIILMPDFCAALKRIRTKHEKFLMVGRRWDTEISQALDFGSKDWALRLRSLVCSEGRQRTSEWIDYFVFPRGLWEAGLPPFSVGRPFWDNWLLWKTLDSKHPVVDASAAVLAVHQNHDYSHHPQGKPGVLHGAESDQNHALTGGWKHLRTIGDATERLSRNELKPNRLRHCAYVKRYARQGLRILFYGGMQRAWFFFLGLTRPVRRMLGLRAENLRRLCGKAELYLGKQR